MGVHYLNYRFHMVGENILTKATESNIMFLQHALEILHSTFCKQALGRHILDNIVKQIEFQ